MRKTLLGGAVMAALVVPLALSPAANAAGDDQFIVNGDFSSPTVNGLLDTPNTTTDFALGDGTLGYGPDNGSMYDPGRYIIGTNPLAVHEAWIDLSGSTDPMLILNGFTEGSQKVWEQTVNTTPCTTAGSSIEFAFSANAMNILRDDWVAANAPGQVGGANISVTINGTQVGDTIDLLSNDPGTIVGTSGSIPAPADGVLDVVIWNNGVAYLGNDFAIDDITLTQLGDCFTPGLASASWTATDPTCDDLDGSGLLLREHATLVAATVNGVEYTNLADFTESVHPNPAPSNSDWVLTFKADEGYLFADGTDTAVVSFHVGAYLDAEVCTPDIGGKTIGFWTNKNGTAAEAAGGLWALVKAEYPVQTAGLNTFVQAQTFIKNATSTGTGITMLRAQFFATALNVPYIALYGAQHITVPTTSAILPGATVTVVEYLNAIEANWASLDTKAEITSVQEVLNAINQDLASELFV